MPDGPFWDKVASDRNPPKKQPTLEGLLASNEQLRAAVITAGNAIKELRPTHPALPILRRALRDARAIARQFEMPKPKR